MRGSLSTWSAGPVGEWAMCGESAAMGSDADRSGKAPRRAPVIRFRAYAIGLALTWLSARWLFEGELVRYTFLTLAAPFCHAVYLLFGLALANLAVVRRWPGAALRPLELVAIYAMVSVASAMMSADLQQILVTLVPYPAYFADQANRWQSLFDGALPGWLVVGDRAVASGFFRGGEWFWTGRNLAAWAVPVAAWTCLLWSVGLGMLFGAALLRRAWVKGERLAFPVVELPMALATAPGPLLANRTFQVGFAIAAGITAMNGLSYLYPSIPMIPIKRQLLPLIATGPAVNAASVSVGFYFFAIALGFLMPFDLGLSIVLFFVAYRVELGYTASLGLPSESRAPYVESQAFGAYMAVVGGAFMRLRGSLREAWRDPADEEEGMPTRVALVGFAACWLLALGMVILAGMRPLTALAFFTIFVALAVLVSRVRAELGFPVHDMHQMGPVAALTRYLGAGSFSRSELGMFGLLHWTSRAYRGHPMPHQVEGLRMAGSSARGQRALFLAMAVAVVAAVPVCWAVCLEGFYRVGAATAHVNQWGTGYAGEAFRNNLQGWLRSPAPPDTGERTAAALGFGIALALAALRQRWPGIPLHPLAYAVANSWGVFYLWLPILIGCLCKGAMLRAGGLGAYRRALPFFFGLMLGEFTAGCTWSLIGMAMGVPTYEFWP